MVLQAREHEVQADLPYDKTQLNLSFSTGL